MDGRRVTLTPGTTPRFGTLGFVYTGPVEPVARKTFTRPPRPNVLTRAAGCEAFVLGFSDDVILGMLRPNPTQERFRLAAYYLTDLAFQASGDGSLGWGEFMERYTAMYAHGQLGLPDDPVTAYVNGLRTPGAAPGSTTTRRARFVRRHDPRGSATSAWPLCRAAPNRSRLRATAAPTPSGVRGLTNSRRRDASSTRSRPCCTKSSTWMSSLAIDNLRRAYPCRAIPERGMTIDAQHKTFLCRGNPTRGMVIGASAVRLQTRRMTAHPRRRHAGWSPTTTDAPMVAQTPTQMPTHHHFFGRHPRTLPLRPCYCMAARSQRPSRSDECASS
jgi:hypothetical protein